MLYILSLTVLKRFPEAEVKICGVFESPTPALHAAHTVADGFGDLRWEEEERETNELLCLVNGAKRIRVMSVEPNKLWPLAYCP